MPTSNCRACIYKYVVKAGRHCDRFKDAPTGRCPEFRLNVLSITTPVRRIELERTR